MNEEGEEIYTLTMWGCLSETLEDYGIEANITSKVGEHLVNDFFKLLEKCGYIERKDDRDANNISNDGESA